jgi:YfiH family protein|tara:strand:+ start:625 stop:1383 length:759 start_codon:yes stop_codon:yes gene_type:complete
MFYSKKLLEFKDIKHCFFSRKNGFSKGVYTSLNCGFGSNDNKINVVKNLEFVTKSLGLNSDNLMLMNQTHSNKVQVINNENKFIKRFNSDALITKVNGLALGVLTADCVPIILYDDKNRSIACIHAGWKGAIKGIVKNTVEEFRKINNETKIFATIGPCIGKLNYEVGVDFFKQFQMESKENSIYFKEIKEGKYLFDLRNYVRNKLIKCGVTNIDDLNYDTFKDSSNFFSYRRSQKLNDQDYGRCLSLISLI